MTRALRLLVLLAPALAGLLPACTPAPRPTPIAPSPPCFVIKGSTELRAKDATKTLEDLEKHIQLSPADEALRDPKTLADLRTILRRDTVYLFANAAAFARKLDTLDGRFAEAALELLMGESQLVGSQVLSSQAAWVGGDLRIARAHLASDRAEPTTDRGRILAQLIRVVEEGNTIADALGAVAPAHIARGAEVIRRLKLEAPADVRTYALVADYHRLRGEWPEFDAAMVIAETSDRKSPVLCYLRSMEQVDRFRRPEPAATMMRECLERFPKFVRGQATLVLMAKSPPVALRELQKLKRMNEDHYLVMLLEPTLAAEQELTRLQEASNAPR